MAKKQQRALMIQKLAVGAAVVVIVGLLGFLYTLVLTEAPLGEFVEGEHYITIENPRRVRGDKVEVMEFFSYGCIHCFNFDPKLNDWVAENRDRVEFVRTPAISSNFWRLLARTYYAMDELGVLEENHSRLFNDLHNARRDLDSLDKMAAWIDGHGTTAAAFKSMAASPAVEQRLELADRLARRLEVTSVPTIVVNGKYLVRITSEVGPTRMLDVMEHLVDKEMAPPAQ